MKKTKRIVSIIIASVLMFSAISLTTVFSASFSPFATTISNIPGTFPAIMTLGPDIMYNTDKMSMPNYPNYASATNTRFNPDARKILVDGWSNDESKVRKSVNAGYLDEPEFVFDFERQVTIGAVRIGGYNANGQSVFFKLFISSDGDIWDEIGNTDLGCQHNAVLAQPVIPFKIDETNTITAASYNNMITYDKAWFQINPLPYPTQYKSAFDEKTAGYADTTQNGKESPFSVGQYKSRILQDPNGAMREVTCFASPQYAKASDMYGISDNNINYINNYFFEAPISCRFVKIVGYGNSSLLYYPFSSFTEVRFAAPAPAPTDQVFSDVPLTHWAEKDIRKLSIDGVVNGYVEGSGNLDAFKPDNTIRREEFVKILTYAFYAYDPFASNATFTDISPSDWYYLFVASAAGTLPDPLAKGIDDTHFGVGMPVSRQDAATFIARALSALTRETAQIPTLADANTALSAFADKDQIADYAKPSVAYLLAKGVIKGYDEAGVITFKPSNLVTRAEMAAMTNKGLHYKTVQQLTVSLPVTP